MAGVLRVRLGGESFYGGERLNAAVLGAEFEAPTVAAARRAMRMARAVTAVAVLATAWFGASRRRG